MCHQLFDVYAVGTRHYHNTSRVFMVGLITQIADHRQFFCVHLSSYLFQHFGTRGLVRQRCDNNVAIFQLIQTTHLDTTAACFVHSLQFMRRTNNFSVGWIIRPLNILHQIRHCGFRVVQQIGGCIGHFTSVVRRNICRHTYSYTRHAVEQNMR